MLKTHSRPSPLPGMHCNSFTMAAINSPFIDQIMLSRVERESGERVVRVGSRMQCVRVIASGRAVFKRLAVHEGFGSLTLPFFCSSERAAADHLGAQHLRDLGQGELAASAPLHRPRGVPRIPHHLQARESTHDSYLKAHPTCIQHNIRERCYSLGKSP